MASTPSISSSNNSNADYDSMSPPLPDASASPPTGDNAAPASAGGSSEAATDCRTVLRNHFDARDKKRRVQGEVVMAFAENIDKFVADYEEKDSEQKAAAHDLRDRIVYLLGQSLRREWDILRD